jgi:hypothetical protein
MFGSSWVLISVRRPDILTEVVLGFLRHFRRMSGWYLDLGRDFFFPHSLFIYIIVLSYTI